MLIALKAKLATKAALAAAAMLTGPALLMVPASKPADTRDLPELIEIAPTSFSYIAPGEFTRDGKPVDAPALDERRTRPLRIMKFEVTAGEYRRCVADGACTPGEADDTAPDRPAVLVNWRDANAYAAWLSRKTGMRFRLPSDEEWTFAAGSRAPAPAEAANNSDPVARWIARYEAESESAPVNPAPQPVGSFGVNEHGLADIAGNVWEWTSSCYTRSEMTADGPRRVSTNCGVRAAEGRHRAFVTDFIRDPRGGGCASGIPPANLGFRLVAEPAGLIAMLRRRLAM